VTLKIAQYGLGQIGREVARFAFQKRKIEYLGAVDVDPQIVGRDIGELLSLDRLGISVIHEKESAPLLRQADVTIHTTSSRLKGVIDQLMNIAKAGSDVVSSCEELSYPFHENPALSRRVNEIAEANGVTILGTGVNPGFAMDTIAIVTSACCQEIAMIEIHRIVDASVRRVSLQKKIGVGMSKEDFIEKVRVGLIGHVGLKESAWMLMDSFDWSSGTVTESIEPVIADRHFRTEHFDVSTGRVCGVDQTVSGQVAGRRVLMLRLQMYLGAKSLDSVYIQGRPPLRMIFEGGIHGDAATPAILLNMAPRVAEASPGLKTMLDMALPRISG